VPVDPAASASPGRKRRAARQTREPQVVVINRQVAEKAKSLTSARRDYHDGLLGFEAKYDAADPNNRFMRRRDGLGGIGDAQVTDYDLWRMRGISRHMVGNDDLIGQSLSRLADNVVQSQGFRLIPQTGDEALDEDISEMFREWANDPLACDFYGERDLATQSWMAFFQVAQDGDIFAPMVDNGTVQLIEADRCQGSRGKTGGPSWLGVDFDSDGRAIRYNFTKTAGSQYDQGRTAGEMVGYDVRDAEGYVQVCHLYDPRRITQHRGLPWMVPLMIKAGMLDDLQFATVVKAQSAAAHAIFFERDAGTAGGPVRIGSRETQTMATPNGGATDVTTEAVRYGQQTTLPPGVKAKLATGPIPNQEHFEHVRHTIRQIGAGLNMPLEMVLLDASQTNYSGWRGAMDQARMSFTRLQRTMMVGQWYCPIYKMFLRRRVSKLGAVARAMHYDGTLYRHRWAPPSWPYINPKEDAEAANVMVTTGQDSPRGIVAKRGGSYDDVIKETVADRGKALRLAIIQAQAIKAELDYEVSPLLILGWDLPGNTALVANQDEMANAASGRPAPIGGPVQPAAPAPPAPVAPIDAPADDDSDEEATARPPVALNLTVNVASQRRSVTVKDNADGSVTATTDDLPAETT
jgi:lambda family phage portal protein